MAKDQTVKTVPRHRKKHKKHRVLLTILVALFMIALIGCLLAAGYIMTIAADLPDITAEDLVTAQTSFVYDSAGNQIATLHGGENRVSVTLDEMPQYLKDAVVASEDFRFYDHHGVDFRSVMRAVVVDLRDTIRNRSLTFSQGASTITMQLVKNVVEETEKTLPRKIKQALLAIQFERNYSKEEILYYYLNEIYMAPSVFGMQAASEYYFNKDVGEVTLAEAATLAAILRAPGLYDPYSDAEGVLVVRNAVLERMADFNSDYRFEVDQALSEPLVVYHGTSTEAAYEYPWFVDYVISEAMDVLEELGLDSDLVYTGGLNIYTTLDTGIQQTLESAFANPDNFPSSSTGDIVESAMVILETGSGQIKGLVGGREYTTRRGFNRASDLRRSPGSTIKPLVTYAPAIELGYGANYVIDDSPAGFGSWSPNNDDHTYMGRITMRTAVMRSRNVCAVKMLQQIGAETGWEYGVKNGLPLVQSDAGLAMTLGGLTYGVAPLEMAGGFATLGNYGIHIAPYSISRITNALGNVVYTADPELTEVFSAATAYIMTDVLTSAVQGGTGTSAYVSGWQVAGKTGTNGLPSEDPDYRGRSGTKDAWFCGYTTALTASVWMGYDNKWDENGNLQYLSNVFGGSYPARLFHTVMTQALAGYESHGWTMPEGVSYQTVDTKTGNAPTELTPAEFVSSDLVRSGMGVGGDGTQWVAVEICADTGNLATEYCPNKELEARLSLANGSAPNNRVDDFELYQPVEYCTQHTTIQTGMVGVYICTECTKSTGVLSLANLPASGASGGCPSESVQLRYYHSSAIPTTYCSIATHQVTGQREDNHGGESSEPGYNDDPWGGQSGGSSELSAPSSLTVSSFGGALVLTWAYGGGGSGDIMFVIERQDLSSGVTERFFSTDTSYVDSAVNSNTSYSYRVYAFDNATSTASAWSSTVTDSL